MGFYMKRLWSFESDVSEVGIEGAMVLREYIKPMLILGMFNSHFA